MNICVIGLGLLGGSFALGLKKHSPDIKILGIDINPDHCREAVRLNIADKILELEDAVTQSHLIVLATPVNILLKQLSKVLDIIPEGSVVIDFGSTKQLICQQVNDHTNRSQYIAMHPIAGTEYSGPEAAFPELLQNQTMIICEKEKSSEESITLVESLFRPFNMRYIFMKAEEHDRHIAYVSHLSHISSFALSTTVLEIEKDEKSIFNLAGSGFSSTVRLAKSSPDMWAPIFSQNKKFITKALGEYIKQLQDFKSILNQQDEDGAKRIMTHANDIRRILKE